VTNLLTKVMAVEYFLRNRRVDESHIVAITINGGEPSVLMEPDAFCKMVNEANIRGAVRYSRGSDDSHHFCLTIDGVRVAVCCIDDAELADTPLQSFVEESHNVS
jgi:hypothetical protein